MPRARAASDAPTLPSCARVAASACARAPSVRMPSRSSVAAVCGPTPGRARTPMGAKKSASQPGYTTVVPLGLLRSLAILLTVLLVESPIEHVMPRRCTAALMRAQTSTGSVHEKRPGVTSKYASSTLICSM